MRKKKRIKLLVVCSIMCMMFCGCGKDNSDNKKTADNIASSTDVVIDNTDMANADSSETPESTSTTTEANTTNSASGGIETESSNAIKDDDTNNNDNKPNNGGNSGIGGNGGEKPQATTTEEPSNPSGGNTTTEDTKPEVPSTTEQPTTETPATEEHKDCEHKWTLVDETIHHDAVYETKEVCVQEAYDEEIKEFHYICNGCGKDMSAAGFSDIDLTSHVVVCQGGSSYHTGMVVVNTIHHDAVYETQTVCVQQAWDEIVTHTICSICGYQIN